MTVDASYRYCDALARRTAKNFYPAFVLLPRSGRRAMAALYSFFRVTDDLADEPGEPHIQRQALIDWRNQLDAAMRGQPGHPIHPALVDAINRFGIPISYLHAAISGVEADLFPRQPATFGELAQYCELVASAVGLACIHVWGFHGEAAVPAARDAGIAFQLTNILRDLSEDRALGRIYLPADELAQWQCPPESWSVDNAAFQEMMRFQVDRARCYFARGRKLRPMLSPPGRAIFAAMCDTYESLLNEVADRRHDVFTTRVRIPGWRKASFVLRALPQRWGWGS